MDYQPFPPFRFLLATASLIVLSISLILWWYVYAYESALYTFLSNDMFYKALFGTAYLLLTSTLVELRHAPHYSYSLRMAVREVWSRQGTNRMLHDVTFLSFAGLIVLVTYMLVALWLRNDPLTIGGALLILGVVFWYFWYTRVLRMDTGAQQ
ncbi:MAG: hypothetical protein KBD24_04215 [Candidatus Pacebacteria bacterium]|nr:hypothetical protein [Candidatus Paceibacterota bacterium]